MCFANRRQKGPNLQSLIKVNGLARLHVPWPDWNGQVVAVRDFVHDRQGRRTAYVVDAPDTDGLAILPLRYVLPLEPGAKQERAPRLRKS